MKTRLQKHGKKYLLALLLAFAGGTTYVGNHYSHKVVVNNPPVVQPSPQPSPAPVPVPVSGRIGPAEAYPHSDTQPGVLSNLDPAQTCMNPAWRTSSIRPPVNYTTTLKVKQLANGYAYNGDTATKDFEEDHICSLEICGDPKSEQNLWPQPYTITWNGIDVGAKIKDKVENAEAKDVKSGKKTPQQACSELGGDWIKAGINYGIIVAPGS